MKSARVSRVLVDTNLTDCSAIDLNEKYIDQTLTSLTGHNDITMMKSQLAVHLLWIGRLLVILC